MDIYNGAGSILNWIGNAAGSIGNVLVDSGNYTASFFNNIGAAVTAGIGSLIYYPVLAIISFLALVQYVLYVIVSLVSYLFAPIWFIINFLTGLWAAIQQNYSIVYLNGIYTDNAINNFIAGIPGYATIMVVINATLWVILSLHLIGEFKKI